MKDLKAILAHVATGASLTESESETAFDILMSGDATPSQMGAFLMALRVRGETVPEILGAAKTMRAKMTTIKTPAGAIDTCGTGGDAKGTHNISTATTFVVAGEGVPVAKHGNRALSSKAGAADVLTALGINMEAPLDLMEQALADVSSTFLMAPRHHTAMRHVGPTRVELGTRTLFNLLGPLCNPGCVKRQLLGVFDKNWILPLAEVLKGLGHEHAWVVHGKGGFDEMTTTDTSYVCEVKNGEIHSFEITPEEVGLPRSKVEDLMGGDAEFNAKALREVLSGAEGAFRDTVLLTSGAAFVVAGKVEDIKDGIALAKQSIASGRAIKALDDLVAYTNRVVEA